MKDQKENTNSFSEAITNLERSIKKIQKKRKMIAINKSRVLIIFLASQLILNIYFFISLKSHQKLLFLQTESLKEMHLVLKTSIKIYKPKVRKLYVKH